MKSGGITVGSSLLRVPSPTTKSPYMLPSSLTLNSYASLRKLSAMTPISVGQTLTLPQNDALTQLSSRNGTIDGSIRHIIEESNETCHSSSSLSKSEILVDPTSAEIHDRFKHVQVKNLEF